MRRIGLLLIAAAVGATGLAGCTVPPPPKVTFTFTHLRFPIGQPNPGADLGDSPSFTYIPTNAPTGAQLLLQRLGGSGATARWANVQRLPVSTVGSGFLNQPPQGRNRYRIAMVDAKGKLLTYTEQSLDVYQGYTFGLVFNLPLQTFTNSRLGTWTYYFTSLLEDPAPTSCRSMNLVVHEITGNQYTVRFNTYQNGKPLSTSVIVAANPPPNVLTHGFTLELGKPFSIQILGSGLDSYVWGNAFCLTGDGTLR